LFNQSFAAAMLVIAGIALLGAALAWLTLRGAASLSGGSPFAGKDPSAES
jgi:hypothetical protein